MGGSSSTGGASLSAAAVRSSVGDVALLTQSSEMEMKSKISIIIKTGLRPL